MAAYRALLEKEFPHVFSVMEKTPVEEALLLKWEGNDPSLLPVVLSGHMDVVDADSDGWDHPPFAGEIAEGQGLGPGCLGYEGSPVCIPLCFRRKVPKRRNAPADYIRVSFL